MLVTGEQGMGGPRY